MAAEKHERRVALRGLFFEDTFGVDAREDVALDFVEGACHGLERMLKLAKVFSRSSILTESLFTAGGLFGSGKPNASPLASQSSETVGSYAFGTVSADEKTSLSRLRGAESQESCLE